MNENDQKLQILQQVKDGTIEVSEGLELLNNLNTTTKPQKAAKQVGERIIRVKVESLANGKVDTTIPLSLIKTASRLGILSASFIPYEVRKALKDTGLDLTSSGIKDLIAMIDEGEITGRIVEVDVDSRASGQMHIEVYVD